MEVESKQADARAKHQAEAEQAETRQAETTEAEVQATQTQRKVLVVLDGSERSVSAFEWYMKRIAWKSDKVILVYCEEQEILDSGSGNVCAGLDNVMNQLERLGEKLACLNTIIRESDKWFKLHHSIKSVYGNQEEIAGKDWANDLDMVVTTSLDDTRRTIVSNAIDYIVEHCRIPVLIWSKSRDEL